MLTGNNLFTTLLQPLAYSQTSAQISNAAALTLTAGNHTYLLIDDGAQSEVVKATASAAGVVTIERGQFGTTPKNFVKGVCVKGYTGYEFICELIAQGGCSGGGVVSCTPVTKGGIVFQDAVVGTEWNAAVTFNNATSIVATNKPAWVNVMVNSGALTLTGTAPAGQEDFSLIVVANGCNNSSVTVDRVIKVCQPIGVQA